MDIAASTMLPHARKVALAAAAAWAHEAEDAEAREAGGWIHLSEADAAIALEFLLDEDLDAEDPDSLPEDTALPSGIDDEQPATKAAADIPGSKGTP